MNLRRGKDRETDREITKLIETARKQSSVPQPPLPRRSWAYPPRGTSRSAPARRSLRQPSRSKLVTFVPERAAYIEYFLFSQNKSTLFF